MPLLHHTYGKARVRVMRVHRGDPHTVRELSVHTMLEGAFAPTFDAADNTPSLATDTIKNLTYVTARETLGDPAEHFAAALATKLLTHYPQIASVRVTTHETRWARAHFAGTPHPHSFTLDANGTPTATVDATRAATTYASGIDGYTFLKSTQSGWSDFVSDRFTTLPPTTDRLAATAMDAHWTWTAPPADFDAANARILPAMLETFATTYSHSIQDSLYRMGEAALAAVPELATIRMACPNKHYIPVDLTPFGLSADNAVFVPTDEPHGQIECTVGR